MFNYFTLHSFHTQHAPRLKLINRDDEDLHHFIV